MAKCARGVGRVELYKSFVERMNIVYMYKSSAAVLIESKRSIYTESLNHPVLILR
jgi:hypothetical protein